MANTKAATPKYRLYVSVDTNQRFEMPQPYTALEAQHFAAVTVQEGWWHESFWYPPHRLNGIRTEPWGQS